MRLLGHNDKPEPMSRDTLIAHMKLAHSWPVDYDPTVTTETLISIHGDDHDDGQGIVAFHTHTEIIDETDKWESKVTL